MSTTASGARPLGDSLVMVRRNLKRVLRYPSMTLQLIGTPVLLLLLFVHAFGGVLGAGLGVGADGFAGGRDAYLVYVLPAILVMTITTVVQGTAISVAMDLTEGVITRFRTMDIARTSVLTGHVVGGVIQSALGGLVLFAVALLLGFRPGAGPLGLLAALGFHVLVSLALVWLTIALGQVSESVETASTLPMPLMFLPFLGSGFVPAESMPAGLRWFAENQPFSPIIETLRALLAGTGPEHLWPALGWCALIGVGGFLWSKRLYDRER